MSKGTELFGSVYENGEIIFQQDDPGDTMYIIQSGAVEISQKEDGKDKVIAVLEKGAMFGELALLHKGPRSATAKSAGQARLLSLTSASLIERVRQDPGVALRILQGLTRKIYRADQRLRQIVDEDDSVREALAKLDDNGAKTATGASSAADPTSQESITDVPFAELAKAWAVQENAQWIDAGQQIFGEGEAAEAMYIILDGAVEISQGSGAEKQVLTNLGAGSFFGELAIIADTPRSATATAASRTQLMIVKRDEFLDRITGNPDIALFIIKSMIGRLRQKEESLADPRATLEVVRQSWHPIFKKTERVRVAIVSLSTCAGCSAVLLDDEVLAKVTEHTNIVYCPMLMDQTEMPEVDLALVDGVVRLKEDAEKLAEARAKSKFLVAWGTCASFGGIPAEANRYELEELIAQTYGQAEDTFAHYLSGKGGVVHDTYQDGGVALMRKATKLDDFVRVDYYVPGCPPHADYLLQLVGELIGNELQKVKPTVCAECGRKISKTSEVTSLKSFSPSHAEQSCFNSQGVMCAGFMTRGGCEAECTKSGVPCWGCRGPAKNTLGKMEIGDSFEELMIKGISTRCRLEESEVTPLVKQLRRQSHNLFDFHQNSFNCLQRIR